MAAMRSYPGRLGDSAEVRFCLWRHRTLNNSAAGEVPFPATQKLDRWQPVS
jgi:hypothetical protein